MAADLEELLRRAAGQAAPGSTRRPSSLRGLRRRRRRRLALAGGTLAAAAVAVAVVAALPRAGVELAEPVAGPDWPLALRYELTRELPGDGSRQPRRAVGELAANSWEDWVHVVDAGDGSAHVTRFGPGGRLGYGEIAARDLETPFAALDAAADVQLAADEEPLEGRLAPSDMLSTRFGDEPADDDDNAVTHDLPELRRAVADRLGLDPDALRSARVEREQCPSADYCGTQAHTFVWLPGPGVPLYAEEVDPDDARSELVITHLRNGVPPPHNPLPEPPPLPPEWTPEPPSGDALAFTFEGVEFRLGEGSHAAFHVRNDSAEPRAAPRVLALERFDGDDWVPGGDLAVEGPDAPDAHKAGAAVETPAADGEALAPDSRVWLRVRLPDDVEPGFHRLVTVGDRPQQVIAQFFNRGDPNR